MKVRFILEEYWMKAAIAWLFVQTTEGWIQKGFIVFFFVIIILGAYELMMARRDHDEEEDSTDGSHTHNP